MDGVTIIVVRYPLEPKPGWEWLPKWKWLRRWTHEEVETEIEVEVFCEFCRGEPEARDCPGERGYMEFQFATVGGNPFELTDDEKQQAEDVSFDILKAEMPIKWRKHWNI